MTSKSKQIIMAAVGAYLVYTGISLVQETIAGEPKNQILFILVGVFFALFGLATIVWNIRIIVKETKAEIQGTTETTEENISEEAPVKNSVGKGVVDVHVGADTKEKEEKKPADEAENTEEKVSEEKTEDSKEMKTETDMDAEDVTDKEKKDEIPVEETQEEKTSEAEKEGEK